MPRPKPMERVNGRRLVGHVAGRPTHRQELAARVWVYYCVSGQRPERYNPAVGMGRIAKSADRPHVGYSIITEEIYFGRDDGEPLVPEQGVPF